METKFGHFNTEQHISHLWVKVDRQNCAVMTSAIRYPHNVHLSDVTIHTFAIEEESSGPCLHSPTGFCALYDRTRWASLDVSFSMNLCARILIERLDDVLEREGYGGLTSKECSDILERIKQPEEEWFED